MQSRRQDRKAEGIGSVWCLLAVFRTCITGVGPSRSAKTVLV